MKLFIFNPEHEISLAYNRENITMPHVVRDFRHDMAFLPALWAEEGDAILVDDAPSARRKAERWVGEKVNHLIFITADEVSMLQFDMVIPWGWDKALCRQLLKAGFDEYSLPDDVTLTRIRDMANRLQTIIIMGMLRSGLEDKTVGDPQFCTTIEEVRAQLFTSDVCVCKAPWSSSGRGVRFVKGPLEQPIVGWVRNILERQGGIIVEPYYKKVKDFAMEFYSDGHGTVTYSGLSLFNTSGSAYCSNVLATEATKMRMITKYVDADLLIEIRERICELMGAELANIYAGPFGVDMMVVKGGLLDPCVEINLRMTMGHVALAISPTDDDIVEAMLMTHYKSGFRLSKRLVTTKATLSW